MNILDQLKGLADRNGDGKINKEDLDALKDGSNDSVLDKLKEVADQNDDGKLNLDDAKNIDFGSTFEDLKSKF